MEKQRRVVDPQVDEDQLVQRKRDAHRSAATTGDLAEIGRRWERWAAGQLAKARLLEKQGEHFEASLKLARSEVRRAAAALLREHKDPHTCAALMMRNAAEHWRPFAPLIGYDAAAVSYTKARTWQRCARELDPTLTEIQPRWKDDMGAPTGSNSESNGDR